MPNAYSFAVSPDGSRLVYAAKTDDGRTVLWVRPLKFNSNSSKPEIVEGTDDAVHPFWSPDGRSIGFATSDGKLKTIDAKGGRTRPLANAGYFMGGTWSDEAGIVFASLGALRQISASGGKASRVTELDDSLEETDHLWPSFLPDGRHFLYFAMTSEAKAENRAIYIGSVDSKTRTRLMPLQSMAVYAPPGFILFAQGTGLMARPFDPTHLAFTGDAVPIAEGVALAPTGRAAFTISGEGTLVYRVRSSLA